MLPSETAMADRLYKAAIDYIYSPILPIHSPSAISPHNDESIFKPFLRHDIEADLSRPMSLSHCGLSPLNVSISVIPL